MSVTPAAVVFDVNETLSDLSSMAQRFAEVGAPEHLARLWFASVLRDGFAVAAAGSQESFAVLAQENLRSLLGALPSHREVEGAIEHIMAGFLDLPVHPDVLPAVRALRRAGLRLVTLSNGSAQVAESLLSSAGVREDFERVLSVEDAGVWKPARGAYEYAAERCGLSMSDMLMVAVHPWDIDGAARAGMRTAWVVRSGSHYPSYAAEPDHTVRSLEDLAGALSP